MKATNSLIDCETGATFLCLDHCSTMHCQNYLHLKIVYIRGNKYPKQSEGDQVMVLGLSQLQSGSSHLSAGPW